MVMMVMGVLGFLGGVPSDEIAAPEYKGDGDDMQNPPPGSEDLPGFGQGHLAFSVRGSG
jgi:hypothetical protein